MSDFNVCKPGECQRKEEIVELQSRIVDLAGKLSTVTAELISTVPRSRYEAVCKEVDESEAKLLKVQLAAASEINRLQTVIYKLKESVCQS